jgi:KDO2-lipid IV(A) lauroyltransferase
VRGQLTSWGIRVASALAEAVPNAVGDRVAQLGGRVAYATLGGRRAMAARHQRRVAGHDDPDAVKEVFDSYARYWIEMLRLPAEVRRNKVQAYFDIEGYDHILAGLDAGKGVIVALPHMGGWEYAAAWMGYRGHDMLAVVEPIEPPELFEWFSTQRQTFGLEIVPLGPDVLRVVLGALRDNRIVCLLSDRDLTGDGVEVTFFGERTRLPAGPATLALRTGATLLPAGAYFRGRREHLAVVKPPILVEREGRLRDDIARVTQRIAEEFEALIRVAPQQWHLMQPNWPSDRELTR